MRKENWFLSVRSYLGKEKTRLALIASVLAIVLAVISICEFYLSTPTDLAVYAKAQTMDSVLDGWKKTEPRSLVQADNLQNTNNKDTKEMVPDVNTALSINGYEINTYQIVQSGLEDSVATWSVSEGKDRVPEATAAGNEAAQQESTEHEQAWDADISVDPLYNRGPVQSTEMFDAQTLETYLTSEAEQLSVAAEREAVLEADRAAWKEAEEAAALAKKQAEEAAALAKKQAEEAAALAKKQAEELAMQEQVREALALGKRVHTVSEEEYEILLRIVEAEATGEDVKGRILVANVIMNRVASSGFPDSIEEVVFQKTGSTYQFSPIKDKRYWKVEVTEETIEAVERALAGEDYSQGALFFAARRLADENNMRWFDTALTFLFRHGGHEFFK